GPVQIRSPLSQTQGETSTHLALFARMVAPLGQGDHRDPGGRRPRQRRAAVPTARAPRARRRRHGYPPPHGGLQPLAVPPLGPHSRTYRYGQSDRRLRWGRWGGHGGHGGHGSDREDHRAVGGSVL